MPNPQQPELRRSGRDAVTENPPAADLAAPSPPAANGEAGPVPEDNLPGHHPDDEQDKPEGDDFVAKARAVASRRRSGAADGTEGAGPSGRAVATETARAEPVATVGATSTPAPAGQEQAGQEQAGQVRGDGSPLGTLVSFQWRVATLPVRVAVDVVRRLRHLR